MLLKGLIQDVQNFDIAACSNDDDKGVHEIGSLDGRSYCCASSSYPIEHVVMAPSTWAWWSLQAKSKTLMSNQVPLDFPHCHRNDQRWNPRKPRPGEFLAGRAAPARCCPGFSGGKLLCLGNHISDHPAMSQLWQCSVKDLEFKSSFKTCALPPPCFLRNW